MTVHQKAELIFNATTDTFLAPDIFESIDGLRWKPSEYSPEEWAISLRPNEEDPQGMEVEARQRGGFIEDSRAAMISENSLNGFKLLRRITWFFVRTPDTARWRCMGKREE